MPITFENDHNIIIYPFEWVKSHARRTQQIFVGQCVWWLALIVGQEQGLVFHINRLQCQEDTTLQEQMPCEVSAIPRDLTEHQRVDQVLDCTEKYLRKSKHLRVIAAMKISGQTTTGRIKALRRIRRSLRKAKRISKEVVTNEWKNYSKAEGIHDSVISRRKAANECLRCAGPVDGKGNH